MGGSPGVIDKQVGASGDDGYSVVEAGLFGPTETEHRVGARTTGKHQGWARFTGISGLSGATIDVSHISYYGLAADQGTPYTKIFAEYAAAPTAPTSEDDHTARTRTTAGTIWNDPNLIIGAWNNSPSIVGAIQEIADNFDPSVIQILHDDNGSSQAKNNFIRAYSWDNDSGFAPKLHIEFSVGPAPGYYKLAYTSEPPTPNAWNQLKQDAGTGWKKLLYEGE